MNPPKAVGSAPRFRAWHVVFATLLLSFVGCLSVATGYFRLGADTGTLRSSLLKSVHIAWNKKIAIHLGPLTMGMIRNALLFLPMKTEARAGIEALRAVEAGVYNMPSSPVLKDSALSLLQVDKVMTSRNWERVTYVVHEDNLVVVYALKQRVRAKTVKCCFAVLHDRILVVGSASVKPECLLKLVELDENRRFGINHATGL